jgi:hypothetical protein
VRIIKKAVDFRGGLGMKRRAPERKREKEKAK